MILSIAGRQPLTGAGPIHSQAARSGGGGVRALSLRLFEVSVDRLRTFEPMSPIHLCMGMP